MKGTKTDRPLQMFLAREVDSCGSVYIIVHRLPNAISVKWHDSSEGRSLLERRGSLFLVEKPTAGNCANCPNLDRPATLVQKKLDQALKTKVKNVRLQPIERGMQLSIWMSRSSLE